MTLEKNKCAERAQHTVSPNKRQQSEHSETEHKPSILDSWDFWNSGSAKGFDSVRWLSMLHGFSSRPEVEFITPISATSKLKLTSN